MHLPRARSQVRSLFRESRLVDLLRDILSWILAKSGKSWTKIKDYYWDFSARKKKKTKGARSWKGTSLSGKRLRKRSEDSKFIRLNSLRNWPGKSYDHTAFLSIPKKSPAFVWFVSVGSPIFSEYFLFSVSRLLLSVRVLPWLHVRNSGNSSRRLRLRILNIPTDHRYYWSY